MAPATQTDLFSPGLLQDRALDALLHGAAVAPLAAGWLRVTGSDRVRWLNGMVTNSIQQLAPGEGCFSFALSAQGRIQGTLNAFARPDDLLLETDAFQTEPLSALFDHFIIMDDVELTDLSATRAGVSLRGPQAAELLEKLGLPLPVGELAFVEAAWQGAQVMTIAAHAPLVTAFELWADEPTAETLFAALQQAGAVNAAADSLELLRILEGTPRYGTDIRDRELPQETGQTRALHFSKGCYLGQEIVERIRSRGAVHRTFTGLRFTGALPAPGTAIEAESKPIGAVTSAATLTTAEGPVHLGLGYLRREAIDRGLSLGYAGGSAAPHALPFREL